MKTRGRPRHPDILTPRQQDVLALIRRGLTNDEIAAELGISADGVKFHVSEILRRLGVDSRHEAADWQPDEGRSRWAFLTAPLALGPKLRHGWPAKLVAGTAFVATAVLVVLLAWGVAATRDDDGRLIAVTGEPSPVVPSPPVTGIAEVDAAIRVLVEHDIDGVMALVELAPIGCSTEQTVGSPPSCPAGAPDGSPVDVFGFGQCEGAYATRVEDVRPAVQRAFAGSDRSSIFAVLRDNTADRGQDGYYIVETPGAVTSSSADVRFWYMTAAGKIQSLQSECGPRGAAQQTDYRFPAGIGAGALDPDFVYGPKDDCTPGEYGNLLITVEGVSPGGIDPQFWGPAQDTREIATGTRAIAQVSGVTQWPAAASDPPIPQRIEDVRPGMLLQATGPYDANCVIDAQTILSAIPPYGAATPPAMARYDNPFYGVQLDFPGAWIPDPNYGQNLRDDLWTSYRDPAGRTRGYFYITVLSSPSLDDAVAGWAHHKLRPFGNAPLIEDVALSAGAANLILPDPSDPSLYMASILMPLPVPIPSLFGGTYEFLQLDAHRDDIMRIAQTLAFNVPVPNPPSPPTATP